MKYEIRLGREIVNQTLHIFAGAVNAHTFMAYDSIWVILIILGLLAWRREFQQDRRGKNQPIWIHGVDIFFICLGGLIWYLIVTHFNINVDML